MTIVTTSHDFPEIRLTHTRLTVTISASFEIKERSDANQVESDVEEALAALRRLGEADVSYDSMDVEA